MNDVIEPRVPGLPARIELAKYEGLGNDFLVLVDVGGRHQLDAGLARLACDRHRGFGADGLLRAGPPPPGSSDKITFELRNADGSEAEMSGNGLRCLAHAAIDAGAISGRPGDHFGVLTPAGRREVHIRDLEEGWLWASTEMGTVKIVGDGERCNVGHGQLFVDVGNPHLVVLGPDPTTVDVAALGPALSQEAGAATDGVNVEFVALGPARDELTMRVWERGVGETLACGTGSVAAAAALHYWGRVGPKVTVSQPGGAAEVELRPDGTAVLTGPSRRVGTCRLQLARLARGDDLGRRALMSLIERDFREKIVLVGVTLPPPGRPAGPSEAETERHLDELELLVGTAGADVVGRVHQRRDRPDPATYIGHGKAHDLREVSESADADTVVFDDELSPAQSRNLEKILGRTAIDRTAVILDIFAQNARSEEGKAQVELAQLRYRLPRLRGRGHELSQQAGRIGTRGPGETQLEVDRRRLVRRVHKLESELDQLERRRRIQRQGRRSSRVASVSLVGYTNAGKSTLLNSLTGAGVTADERPFATLDPRTRRFALPGGEPVLLTDTVGFVRKLPHQLVQAFHSTLEVVNEADLLVHLVDSSAPDPEGQIDAVRAVLGEIGAADLPEVLVFNKADLAPEVAEALALRNPGAVAISAATGQGIDVLLDAIAHQLRASAHVVELSIPFSRGDVLAALHREGEVLMTTEGEQATTVRAKLAGSALAQFVPFMTSTAVDAAPSGEWAADGSMAKEPGDAAR